MTWEGRKDRKCGDGNRILLKLGEPFSSACQKDGKPSKLSEHRYDLRTGGTFCWSQQWRFTRFAAAGEAAWTTKTRGHEHIMPFNFQRRLKATGSVFGRRPGRWQTSQWASRKAEDTPSRLFFMVTDDATGAKRTQLVFMLLVHRQSEDTALSD